MNTSIVLLLVTLTTLVSCAPRTKGSDPQSTHYVKGHNPGVKGNPHPPIPALRKGEYMCGDKVCQLKPGEIPKGCDGICQYRIH